MVVEDTDDDEDDDDVVVVVAVVVWSAWTDWVRNAVSFSLPE